MAGIKIDDLPEDMKISKEQMKHIVGGDIFNTILGVLQSTYEETNSDLEDMSDKVAWFNAKKKSIRAMKNTLSSQISPAQGSFSLTNKKYF